MIRDPAGHPSNPSRRKWIARAAGASAAVAATGFTGLPAMGSEGAGDAAGTAPGLEAGSAAAFDIQGTYLNNASTHPLPLRVRAAMEAYLDRRSVNGRNRTRMLAGDGNPKELFGQLINADPASLAMVPSTSFGESFIIAGLGLAGSGARVVTDALHFMGSLYSYGQLAEQGLELEVLRPVDNRIPLEAWDRAITPGTRLVSLSAVTMTTGLVQDLRAICEIAHSRGALVYADVIQAVGAVPFDVQETGVDFCACSSYKWLMGDFGAGFLYVRPDRLDQLQRTHLGYRQLAAFSSHVLPFDPPGEAAFEAAPRTDAAGLFEIGTLASATQAALVASLGMLLETGVESLHAHRQPLLDRLQDALPALGYIPLTPREGASPIVAFARKDFGASHGQRLRDAGITVGVYPHRLRVSPSIYNTMDEIEQLIEVLA